MLLNCGDGKDSKVPWSARKSNQPILKEISPKYSLEGRMLKHQYFGYLMQRTDSLERPQCWERLKARGEGDHRGWDGWMASQTWWAWASKSQELAINREAWHARVQGVTKSRTQLSNWTKPVTQNLQKSHLDKFLLSYSTVVLISTSTREQAEETKRWKSKSSSYYLCDPRNATSSHQGSVCPSAKW